MPASDPLALLLAGSYPDPETGELLAAESRTIVIEDSLAGSEADVVAALGAGRNVCVVSDRTTHVVLGERVERALRGRFDVQSIVVESDVRADDVTVDRLGAAIAPGTDLVVAVGAGTLNDLTKMVAFRRGSLQAVFATAPSMNGYTSLSASITTAGVKRSFRTRTPAGVYFDLGVVAAAPPRLIHAGLGDSACRSTAQADWLLSHLVLDRPYREAPFTLLAADEAALFDRSSALLAGDRDVMRHLVRTLVLSGFGMTICGGSFPASQGEHLLSHYVDMMWPRGEPHAALHGEQVAVCTIAMAELQDRVLDRDAAPVLRPTQATRDDVLRRYGPVIGDACWSELELKHFDRARTDALNDRLARSWDAIRRRIHATTIRAAALRQVLVAAGAPVEPAQLGWPPGLWSDALRHAREIRNRYTFLDLAADAS